MSHDEIRRNLKRLVVQALNLDGLTPDDIGDEEPLFGGNLGLDSVDALELVVALEKEYGISIPSQDVDKKVFTSVATLAEFVERRRHPSPPGAPPDGR